MLLTQLFMCALLHDAAPIQHSNGVCCLLTHRCVTSLFQLPMGRRQGACKLQTLQKPGVAKQLCRP